MLSSLLPKRRRPPANEATPSLIRQLTAHNDGKLPEQTVKKIVDYAAKHGRADLMVALIQEDLGDFYAAEVGGLAGRLVETDPFAAAHLRRLAQTRAPWLVRASHQRWADRYVNGRMDAQRSFLAPAVKPPVTHRRERAAEKLVEQLCAEVYVGCRLPYLTAGARAALLGAVAHSGPAALLYDHICTRPDIAERLPLQQHLDSLGNVPAALAAAWFAVPGAPQQVLMPWLANNAVSDAEIIISLICAPDHFACLRDSRIPWTAWLAHFKTSLVQHPYTSQWLRELSSHHTVMAALVLVTLKVVMDDPAGLWLFVLQYAYLPRQTFDECTRALLARGQRHALTCLRAAVIYYERLELAQKHRMAQIFKFLAGIEASAAADDQPPSPRHDTQLLFCCLEMCTRSVTARAVPLTDLVTLLGVCDLEELELLRNGGSELLDQIRACLPPGAFLRTQLPFGVRALLESSERALVPVQVGHPLAQSVLAENMVHQLADCLQSAELPRAKKVHEAAQLFAKAADYAPVQRALCAAPRTILWPLYSLLRQGPKKPFRTGLPLLDSCTLAPAEARRRFEEIASAASDPLRAAHAVALHDHGPKIQDTVAVWRSVIASMKASEGYALVGLAVQCDVCLKCVAEAAKDTWFADDTADGNMNQRLRSVVALVRALDEAAAHTFFRQGDYLMRCAALEVLFRSPYLLQRVLYELANGPETRGIDAVVQPLLALHPDILEEQITGTAAAVEEHTAALAELGGGANLTGYARQMARAWDLRTPALRTGRGPKTPINHPFGAATSLAELHEGSTLACHDMGTLHRQGLMDLRPDQETPPPFGLTGVPDLTGFYTLHRFLQLSYKISEDPVVVYSARVATFLQDASRAIACSKVCRTQNHRKEVLHACLVAYVAAFTKKPAAQTFAFLETLLDWQTIEEFAMSSKTSAAAEAHFAAVANWLVTLRIL